MVWFMNAGLIRLEFAAAVFSGRGERPSSKEEQREAALPYTHIIDNYVLYSMYANRANSFAKDTATWDNFNQWCLLLYRLLPLLACVVNHPTLTTKPY
jgi:hypothetical protein